MRKKDIITKVGKVMNVKECYAVMHGDYEGVKGRLMTDERIKKFLLKVPQGNPMDEIFENLNNKDYETAFRNVHNMKGVALNLGLSVLANSSSDLCEALRGGEPSIDIESLLNQLKTDYDKFIEILGQMD